MSSALLDLLRSPQTGDRVRAGREGLEAGDENFPVVDGVPILLPGTDRSAGHESLIVDAFRTRSRSYFEDNYTRATPETADRRRRLEQLEGMLVGSVEPGSLVLDAGAGPGVLSGDIEALGGEYVALDLSLDNLLAARERVGELSAVVGNLTALPFRSSAFDVVVAMGCLEYVRDMTRAIGELLRVCRPGGTVIASFANSASPRRWWDKLLIMPVVRLRRAIADGEPYYPRYLAGRARVRRDIEQHGGQLREIHPLNGGMLGYPLSDLERVQRMELGLQRRSSLARLVSSEFMVRAEPVA